MSKPMVLGFNKRDTITAAMAETTTGASVTSE